VLTTKPSLISRSLPQVNVGFHFDLPPTFFLGRGDLVKVVDIDESCFSWLKCNCSRLRDSVGLRWVERKSGRPVLDMWLNAPPRHCSPSLRRVLDLIAYCNLALFITNSAFNPTCVDNGPVNEFVYVLVCMHVCMYPTRHHDRQSLLRGPTFISAMKVSQTTPSSTVLVSWIHARMLTQIRSRPRGSTPI